jgi:hypothetical protein
MTNTTGEVAQTRAARIAGAMFLFVSATGIFSEIFVRGSLLSGDAAQVAQNIVGSERLYRLGIAVDLITFAGVLVLVWALYLLLRPVNRDLALVAGLFRIIEAPVAAAASIGGLIAVQSLSGAEYLEVFEAGELHALSRLARNVFGFGQDVGFIFLGLGSAVFAYLLFKSRYVPRVLAGWGVFASLFFAVYNLVIVVFPDLVETLMYVALAPMGLYEIPLGLWLVTKGARIR